MKRLVLLAVAVGVVFTAGLSHAQDAPKTPEKVQAVLSKYIGAWTVSTEGKSIGTVTYSWGPGQRYVIMEGKPEAGSEQSHYSGLLSWDGVSRNGTIMQGVTEMGHWVNRMKIVSSTVLEGTNSGVWQSKKTASKFRIEHQGSDRVTLSWTKQTSAGEKQPDYAIVYSRIKDIDDEQALASLNNDWFDAMRTGNAEVLDRILSDDYTLGGDDGSVKTKSQYLALIRSGDFKVASMSNDSTMIQINGDVAVVRALWTQIASYQGTDVSGRYRSTDTWLKRDGRWQCIATHESKVLPKAPNDSIEEEILEREHEFNRIYVDHDIAGLERLLTSDYSEINQKGTLLNRDEKLKRFRDSNVLFDSIGLHDLRVKSFGNMAVSTLRITPMGADKGKPFADNLSITDVWVHRDGIWQCVNSHTSKVSGQEPAIEGAWDLEDIRFDDSPIDMTAWGSLKILQNGNFLCTGYDRQSGEVQRTHGGTYSFDGKTLTETITSVGGENMEIKVGQSFTYDIEIKDGKIHLSGQFNDQKLNEVWSHVTTPNSASVVKVKADASVKPTTRADFEEYCKLNEGAWVGRIPLREDVPGVGKKGEMATAHYDYAIVEDGAALIGKSYWPKGTSTWFMAFDEANKQIISIGASAVFGVNHPTLHYSDRTWICEGGSASADDSLITGIFGNDGKTLTVHVKRTDDGETNEFTDVWHRMNQQPETND